MRTCQMPSKVIWGRAVSTYTNGVAEDFKEDLRSVAEAMANHDRVQHVSEKHVNEAFGALARAGLNCKPFYVRADFWAGIGGLLTGISFSVPDALSATATGMKTPSIANLSFPLMVIVLAMGIMLFCWSIYSNSVPRTSK